MIEENKYCSEVMKRPFNKKLMMTKKNDQDLKISAKCWICDRVMLMVMLK